jgi:hypothetical protein
LPHLVATVVIDKPCINNCTQKTYIHVVSSVVTLQIMNSQTLFVILTMSHDAVLPLQPQPYPSLPTGLSDGLFHVFMWPFHSPRCQHQSGLVRHGGRNKDRYSPVLSLVMMASSVNTSEQMGSLPTCLVSTGGSIAVLDRGSTGWLILSLSSPSPSTVDRAEFDRSLLVEVPWVSARYKGAMREEMEPRCRTEVLTHLRSAATHYSTASRWTYSFWSVEHSDVEIPQA